MRKVKLFLNKMNIGTLSSTKCQIKLKTQKSLHIHNISTKSPANIEITWGQCPCVPKENGGQVGGWWL